MFNIYILKELTHIGFNSDKSKFYNLGSVD